MPIKNQKNGTPVLEAEVVDPQTQPPLPESRQIGDGSDNPNVPEAVGDIDFEKDAGAGHENVKATDLQIPFLQVLQKMSPQCDENDRKYIQGARQGMVLNTVTGQIYPGKEGIYVVPCYFDKEIVEWVPRDNGGGIVARHPMDPKILRAAEQNPRGPKNELRTKDGNDLKETAYHSVLLLNPETNAIEWATIALVSTQLKKSKRWNTLMQNRKLKCKDGIERPYPTYALVYKLTTVPEENKKGQSWMGWEFEFAGFVTNKYVYQEAKRYAEAVKTVGVQAPVPEDTPDPGQHDGGGDADERPF